MNYDAVSAPSTPAFRHRWDVFLSFRGEESPHCHALTCNLRDSLEKHSVRVFHNEDGLHGADEITPSLLEAIEDSAASIAIFSPDYASSPRCLEILSKICECRRLLLPVFCGVTPSDVRRQGGCFEEQFRNYEERLGEAKVKTCEEP
ncbi:Toll/interleukin-1 receptor-like protein [Morella rubra]|uniref:Toll/interleukin-1 receptor-like protein n=1 Tax=Morella rubra TaxID=262757 RepID=A0A6A1V9W0_9ROSI|nr:Toll/interleukin-1 receptor-like protein [Morella rubra]